MGTASAGAAANKGETRSKAEYSMFETGGGDGNASTKKDVRTGYGEREMALKAATSPARRIYKTRPRNQSSSRIGTLTRKVSRKECDKDSLLGRRASSPT